MLFNVKSNVNIAFGAIYLLPNLIPLTTMPLLNLRLIIALLGFTLFAGYAHGQENTAINKIVKTTQNYFDKLPSEKLYFQFDKPYYNVGDTVWFKTYLLNSATLSPSGLSSKIYLELLNDSSRCIKRLVIPVADGLAEGILTLDEQFTDGAYTVRAYTNWMQNFDNTLFFSKQLYIGSRPSPDAWFINEQHTVNSTAAGRQINLVLGINDLKKLPVSYQDVELKVTQGTKNLFTGNYTTSDAGRITSTFNLPQKKTTDNLTLVLTNKTSKKKLTVPISIYAGDKDIDVQFMPEGGYLVANVYNKVGFKSINDSGYGEDIKGTIRNDKDEDIIAFESLHNGMGSFMLLPAANQKYHAVINRPGGKTASIDLPLLKPNGIGFRIDNLSGPDSVKLYITANLDAELLKKPYYLIAQSKDVVHFGVPVNLSNGFHNLRIPKSNFKTGIVCFTLLDESGKALNERRIFINRHDGLKINIGNNKLAYNTADSATIVLTVTDGSNKPIEGNFSASVTDDALVKGNPDANNIYSNFLLTSEIKGNIEEPGWYFAGNDVTHDKAIDNLLLTQAWAGYNWDNVLPPAPKFKADTGNTLSGRLTNLFNKPMADTKLSLFSVSNRNGFITIDTTSNAQGQFTFNNLPLVDTIAYTLKVRDKKGKSKAAGIDLDLFKPAPILQTNTQPALPWYMLKGDSLMFKYFDNYTKSKLPGVKNDEIKGKLLSQVNIRSLKKRVLVGDEYTYPKQELTEKDLIAAGKTTLLDLLNSKYPAFKDTYYYSPSIEKPLKRKARRNYAFNGIKIHDFFIDSISVLKTLGLDGDGETQGFDGEIDTTANGYYDFLRAYLSYVTADQVKHVQLMTGLNYYINITTRSGAGPFLRNSPGTVAYRPLPLTLPREFYKPKYTVKNPAVTDNRTTIDWEPYIVTDKDGKASFRFYTAGKPATYTITIEGTDMAGGIGYQTGTISVTSKATAGK